jgi:MFS family permease
MQFIFMLILDRYKTRRLIDIGFIATSLTFLGYFLSSNWQMIFLFQIVLGFSWANLYLGSMKFLLEHNNEQATATGLLNSVLGLSGLIGPLIGGVVALLGVRVLFVFSALLSLSALFVCRSSVFTNARNQAQPAG